jgi:hypothetical protein
MSYGDAPVNMQLPWYVPAPPAPPSAPTAKSKAIAVPPVDAQLFAIGAGVIAGVLIGKEAVKHLFVEGLEPKERRGMLIASAIGLYILGAKYVLDLDAKWYDVEAWLPSDEKPAQAKP